MLTASSELCSFTVYTRWRCADAGSRSKIGKQLGVRIPKPLAEDAEVKEGTVLNLAVSDGKVVATPVQKKRLSLKQLLEVNKKNLHDEVDLGSPVGREIW